MFQLEIILISLFFVFLRVFGWFECRKLLLSTWPKQVNKELENGTNYWITVNNFFFPSIWAIFSLYVYVLYIAAAPHSNVDVKCFFEHEKVNEASKDDRFCGDFCGWKAPLLSRAGFSIHFLLYFGIFLVWFLYIYYCLFPLSFILILKSVLANFKVI